MIINVRGTNGSGKSWILHKLIHHMGGLKPVQSIKQKSNSNKQLAVGRCRKVIKGKKVYIVGIYNKSSGGGCDMISNQPKIYELVAKYSKRGHVVLEGLLMSGMCGSLTEMSSKVDAQVVWAVLDTPWEKCYKATLLRRHLKGNFKFLNVHKHMIRKHMSVVSSAKFALKHDEYVKVLDHTQAFDQILEMLRDGKVKRRKSERVTTELNVIRDSVLETHASPYDKCKTCLDYFPASWYEAGKDE